MTRRDMASYSIMLMTCMIATTNAARILGIFPIPAKSHFSCNHAIMKSLHAAGHQVTMITPFLPEKKAENFTYIAPPASEFYFVGQSKVDEWNDMSWRYMMNFASELAMENCESVMSVPQIQDALRSSEKLYDAIMAEHMPDFECYLPIAEKLGIPFIGTITMHSLMFADQAIGLPSNPAVVPVPTITSSVEMNLFERAKNLGIYLFANYFFYSLIRSKTDEFYHKYFPRELHYKKDVSLIFYNNHPSLLPRSYVPNAIDVGGIHVPPARPLPTDIQKFIDDAPHGVILFTFGSIVDSSSIPAEKKEAFLTAFASIPQRVIWKYEEPLEHLPKNIMILPWLPQRDILEHKNVITFMSHCGLSGILEAVTTGTPVVAIPLFADQQPNAALIKYRRVGVYLDYKSATKETILAALNSTINDTRYYEQMQELSRIFKDRPMSPQESVVYWTEYVIRHNGAPHLRAIGTDIPLYQYLMLDIIALVLILTSLTIAFIYTATRKLYFLVANEPILRVSAKKNE